MWCTLLICTALGSFRSRRYRTNGLFNVAKIHIYLKIKDKYGEKMRFVLLVLSTEGGRAAGSRLPTDFHRFTPILYFSIFNCLWRWLSRKATGRRVKRGNLGQSSKLVDARCSELCPFRPWFLSRLGQIDASIFGARCSKNSKFKRSGAASSKRSRAASSRFKTQQSCGWMATELLV